MLHWHRPLAICLTALGAGLFLLVGGTAQAQETRTPMSPDWWACVEAAGEVEALVNSPDHLLAAVALNETGRRAPNRGLAPWPWTINVGGRGLEFATKDQAVFAARQLLASGRRSFDVGCMQVNMRFHPRAFTSFEEAFDPLSNMLYAADYIARLRRQHGSWSRAVELYHSYNEDFNQIYGARFQAMWDLTRRRAARGDVLLGARGDGFLDDQAGFRPYGEAAENRQPIAIDMRVFGGLRAARAGRRHAHADLAFAQTPMVAALLTGDRDDVGSLHFIRNGANSRQDAILRRLEQSTGSAEVGS